MPAFRRLVCALALLFGLTTAALVLPSVATASTVPPPKVPVANRVELVHTKTVFTSELAQDAPELLWRVIRLTELIGSSGGES